MGIRKNSHVFAYNIRARTRTTYIRLGGIAAGAGDINVSANRNQIPPKVTSWVSWWISQTSVVVLTLYLETYTLPRCFRVSVLLSNRS